jgi:hypothetical protein
MRSGQLVEYADNISQSDPVVADAENQLKVRKDADYGTHDAYLHGRSGIVLFKEMISTENSFKDDDVPKNEVTEYVEMRANY